MSNPNPDTDQVVHTLRVEVLVTSDGTEFYVQRVDGVTPTPTPATTYTSESAAVAAVVSALGTV